MKVYIAWCEAYIASISGGYGGDNKNSEDSMEEIYVILRKSDVGRSVNNGRNMVLLVLLAIAEAQW